MNSIRSVNGLHHIRRPIQASLSQKRRRTTSPPPVVDQGALYREDQDDDLADEMAGPIAESLVSSREWTTDNELVDKYVKYTISIRNVTGDCPAQVRAYCADGSGDDHYALCVQIDGRHGLARRIWEICNMGKIPRDEAEKYTCGDPLWYEITAAELQVLEANNRVYEDKEECKKACGIGVGYQRKT